MGTAYRAAIGQPLIKVFVDATAQRSLPGKIDINGAGGPVQLRQLFVAEHLVVAAQRGNERPVGRRGQTDDMRGIGLPAAQREAVRRAVGGFARRARQQHLPRAKKMLLGQKIVDQERGDEQRLEDGLLRLMLGTIVGIAIAKDKLVIGWRQVLSMGAGIDARTCRDTLWPHHQVRAHRHVAVDTAPDVDARSPRFRHDGKTPNGDAAPFGVAGRKKLPVLHRFTKGGVGDVVRRQRKVVDGQAYLTIGQHARCRCIGIGRQAGTPQVVAGDEKTQAAVRFHLVSLDP